MNLADGLRHLYPGIGYHQFDIQRDDNTGGPYLKWLDPALGTPPTQAEVVAAVAAYQKPSYLNGGEREPTVSEMQADLLNTYYFLFWRVQKKIAAIYASPANRFIEVVRDPDTGQFTVEGRPEKAAKFAQVTGGGNRAKAQNLLNWESDVFDYLATRWAAIDPNGDFTGTGGVAPPTWASLDADIDANHPAP